MLDPLKPKYWEMYFGMAYVAQRMTVARREQTGCVIVTRQGLILPGYNGQPAGHHTNCCENTPIVEIDPAGNKVQRMKTDVTVIHAEDNAIRKAKVDGIDLDGAHAFITVSPCPNCCEKIIEAGITDVHYDRHHDDMSGIARLAEEHILVHPR